MERELVLLRADRDRGVVAQVWEDRGEVVLICAPTDEAWNAVERGDLYPVGFRRSDVCRYYPDVQKRLAAGPLQWSELEPFRAEAAQT